MAQDADRGNAPRGKPGLGLFRYDKGKWLPGRIPTGSGGEIPFGQTQGRTDDARKSGSRKGMSDVGFDAAHDASRCFIGFRQSAHFHIVLVWESARADLDVPYIFWFHACVLQCCTGRPCNSFGGCGSACQRFKSGITVS